MNNTVENSKLREAHIWDCIFYHTIMREEVNKGKMEDDYDNNVETSAENAIYKCNAELMSNVRYRELITKQINIIQKLKELIPQKNIDLIFNLDEIDIEIYNISSKYIYEKGFDNGIKYKKAL